MSDTEYNIQFNKLCHRLQLGELTGIPEAISGGLLHRMYRVETDQATYAIKALNPQIMLRTTALLNFIHSERIAILAADLVSALPAKQYNGVSVQELDNQYYLIFDWIEGRSLRPNEITTVHCEKMGELVAGIHKTDFSELGIPSYDAAPASVTNWSLYIQQGEASNSLWKNLLSDNVDLLYIRNTQAIHAAELLEPNKVISHGDLDSKNVMWNQDSPIVIDWEASGYINPMHNLIETAIYWAETETGVIDKERFLAFIRGYKKKYGSLHANWKAVLDNGYLGKLGWLEYNLKRSLWIECTDETEQQMGTEQAIATINALNSYADQIRKLTDWLNNEI